MDQIEEVSPDLQSVKGENAIIIRLKDGFKETKIILTNQVGNLDKFNKNVFFKQKSL